MLACRVQFTPDLLPSDVTGVNVFDQRNREFEFQHGPVFGNIVLGDEINRAPPKTQTALLEAMEENQVTVDGETRDLPDPFTVIATQNAVEPNRTYDLPLAELDRFMKKLRLGYPDPEEEHEILARTVGHHPIESLEAVTDRETVVRARETVTGIRVEDPIRAYATRLAGYTRENAEVGASPRGTISPFELPRREPSPTAASTSSPTTSRWRRRSRWATGSGRSTASATAVPSSKTPRTGPDRVIEP